MERKERRRLPWVLMALGAAMALFALAMLSQTRDVLQYCAPAPTGNEAADALRTLEESTKKVREALGDSVSWVAAGGIAETKHLRAGEGIEDCTLYAMGEGWLEVYPRFIVQGSRISETELRQGARVAMLDEDLSFQLFGEELPANATLELDGKRYRVVGTVRHAGSLTGGRGVGDIQRYDAYVPLKAAAADGIPLDVVTLSALPSGSSGAATQFDAAAREEWLAGGTTIDIGKERMRRTILPRILLLIVGAYALADLFRRMTRLCAGWADGFRAAMKRDYLGRLFPRLAGIVLLGLLGYGALIGLTWLLMYFSVQPLYVFTEWVPENPVAWSAIAKVFWNLTSAAGALVRVGSRELRVVEFWGGVVRWGSVLFLLGAALLPKARGARSKRRREKP